MRAFLEAVLDYTKAEQVVVIGHSMGVTIARKIVQGGEAIDQREGSYQVGSSLKGKVKSFIGLAGANYGLTYCWNNSTVPACSNIDGFNPGTLPSSGPSKFMAGLNSQPSGESTNVFTIWSEFDDIIGEGCIVWERVTCRIPGQKA
jgi:triacylglycerol lipase